MIQTDFDPKKLSVIAYHQWVFWKQSLFRSKIHFDSFLLHLVILIHLLLIHFEIFSVKPNDFKDLFADVEDLSYSNMFLPPKIRIKIHINCRTYGPGTYWYQNRPRNIEEDGRMMHRIISYHILNVSAHPITKWPLSDINMTVIRNGR